MAATYADQQPAWSDHYIIALTGHRPADVFAKQSRAARAQENPYDLNNPHWQALQQQLEQTVEQRLQAHPDRHFQLRTGMALGADLVWAKAMINLKARHPDRITTIAFIPNKEQADRWPRQYQRNPQGGFVYNEQGQRLLDPTSNVAIYYQCLRQIGSVYNSYARFKQHQGEGQPEPSAFALMNRHNRDMLFAGTKQLTNPDQVQGVDELFSFWDGLDGGTAQTTQLAVNHNQALTATWRSEAPQIRLTHFDPKALGFPTPQAGDTKPNKKDKGKIYATHRLSRFPADVVEQSFPSLAPQAQVPQAFQAGYKNTDTEYTDTEYTDTGGGMFGKLRASAGHKRNHADYQADYQQFTDWLDTNQTDTTTPYRSIYDYDRWCRW